jgi:site-specific recombinase XerD
VAWRRGWEETISQASPRTVASYRDTLRLLLSFVERETGKAPSALDIEDLDARVISAFLDYLEAERHNTPRTRNARLGAIRSLFRYAALRHPEHAELIAQVLAIPQKRFARATVSFLTPAELKALLAAPDLTTWEGRRDRALILLGAQTGLRVSEIIGLNRSDVCLGTGAHLRCEGKGRKQRAVPLTGPVQAVLREWTRERGGQAGDPLFPTRTGRRLSRDAVERRVSTHTAVAARQQPSLHDKRVSPHVLRHSAAMSLQGRGVASSATFRTRREAGTVRAADSVPQRSQPIMDGKVQVRQVHEGEVAAGASMFHRVLLHRKTA